MRNATIRTLALAAGLAMTAGTAIAQDSTVTGAAGGAATGAILGGPVGAAVGGVAGAALGSTIDPPPAEVRQVVIDQQATSVAVEGEVAVGQPLPETVTLQPVPGYDTYTYAIVNERRVIVDPQTRVVVDVVN
ncbi:DUF1236 domain-containing protein [Chthonobacter rhizosphaerae]|uniref:DUF1236 domain-containing protein n=1 Tax=Chthonobacter rhizosphaerae TaxID=2735553 RepID=UPI0015EF5FA9|nr:DUF1236 domain-containing protein [Chthonobacter rhizosphaerae]